MTKRGFWRIVYETSEHEGKQAGTFATLVRNMAKAPLRPSKIRNGGIGWLSVPTAIVTAPFKLVSKAINAASKTDDKYMQMYENVRKLYEERPEEFLTLVEGLKPNVIRENKINDLYLTAVYDVVNQITSGEMAASAELRTRYDQTMKRNEAYMSRMIDVAEQQYGLTKEEAKFLFSDRAELDDTEKAELDRIESKAIASGAITRDELDRKQSDFGNLRAERNRHYIANEKEKQETEQSDVKVLTDLKLAKAWKGHEYDPYGPTFIFTKLFNRYNPQNREMIGEFADLEDEALRQEALGHSGRATDLRREIDLTRERNTDEKTLPFGIVISKGNAHHEVVNVLPNTEKINRSTQLLRNVLIATSLVNAVNSFREAHQITAEQARLDQHLQDHNAQLDGVNINNSQLEQEYQNALDQIGQYAQNGTPTQETYEAFDTIINQNMQGILPRYHDAYVTFSNQVPGGQWPFSGDAQMHEMVENMNASYDAVKQTADALAQQGNFEEAIKQLIDFNNSQVQPEVTSVMQCEVDVWNQAINAGSQYSSTYQSMADVTQQAINNQGNIENLLNQMANSKITVPTINGTMENAQHIGEFQLEIPSSVAPSLALLGISLANGIEDEVRRATQDKQRDEEATPRRGHFFSKDKDNDDGERY